MSTAFEIAAERYANGEITKDEYEEIKSSLAPIADRLSKPTNQAVPPETAPSNRMGEVKETGNFLAGKVWKGLQISVGIVIAIFVIIYVNYPFSTGLTVGNIEGRGFTIRFDIVNNSTKTGDVLMWIVKNNIRKCEYVFSMKANWRIRNLSVPCTTGEGVFSLNYIWASSNQERASVARRLTF